MSSIVTHLAWKPKPMMEVEAVSRELTLTFVTAAHPNTGRPGWGAQPASHGSPDRA